MMRRRPAIKPRVRVFLGCEGQGEVGYGTFIAGLVNAASLPFHIHSHPLTPGAGDPLARIKLAVKDLQKFERQCGAYKFKAVLMDLDQVSNAPARRHETEVLANQHGIDIIWQDICHETLLLHHFAGCSHLRPPSAAIALTTLQNQWAEYAKPMREVDLSKKLDLNAIKRAAVVEPLLRAFDRSWQSR
jgi:hypothetical protein